MRTMQCTPRYQYTRSGLDVGRRTAHVIQLAHARFLGWIDVCLICKHDSGDEFHHNTEIFVLHQSVHHPFPRVDVKLFWVASNGLFGNRKRRCCRRSHVVRHFTPTERAREVLSPCLSESGGDGHVPPGTVGRFFVGVHHRRENLRCGTVWY
jgi:hypothetical protein